MSLHPPVTLSALHVSVDRAGRSILGDVDVTLDQRSRLAIIGPNGVGKSTLLAVLAGDVQPDSGTITRAPRAMTVGFVHQELDSLDDETGFEFLARRTGIEAVAVEFEAAAAGLADDDARVLDRYAVALDRWSAFDVSGFDARVEMVSDDLDLSTQLLMLPTRAFSGGQAARLSLAVVLLSRFDITLLDEPTNDLDLSGLDRLERWVHEHRGGLGFVSHDRAFSRTCRHVGVGDRRAPSLRFTVQRRMERLSDRARNRPSAGCPATHGIRRRARPSRGEGTTSA